MGVYFGRRIRNESNVGRGANDNGLSWNANDYRLCSPDLCCANGNCADLQRANLCCPDLCSANDNCHAIASHVCAAYILGACCSSSHVCAAYILGASCSSSYVCAAYI